MNQCYTAAMKPKTIYLALCFVGAILPYWKFFPWLLEHGLNLALFWQELFVNRISGFFAMDVLVSAVVFIVLARAESVRLGIRGRWIAVLAVLTVGVSLGLPLFLYMRELKLERDGVSAAKARS
jgi:hypothetical protein